MSTALLRAAIERAAQKRGTDVRAVEPSLTLREAAAGPTAARRPAAAGQGGGQPAAPAQAAAQPAPMPPPVPPLPAATAIASPEQQAAAGRPVAAAQFARTILDAERRESARAMREMVTGVDAAEISRLVQVIAKLKARYAAMVLELGRSDRVGSNSIVATIKTLREQVEELEKGLGFIRQAVADGEIRVAGVQPPVH